MIEGWYATPNTSAPRLKTFVATYWFAPLIKLTTAITAATPMTTPSSVSTLRSLCAQRLEVAIATASEKFIVDGLAMRYGRDRETGPHPNIRKEVRRNYIGAGGLTGFWNGRKSMKKNELKEK